MTRDGFSLVEMLVVLLVIGLMASALSLGLQNRLPHSRLDASVAATLEELRERQRAAIAGDRVIVFSLDEMKRLARQDRRRMIASAEIEIQGAEPARPGEVLFFPGGWSSGGKIVLRAGGHQSVVTVDWPLGIAHAERVN